MLSLYFNSWEYSGMPKQPYFVKGGVRTIKVPVRPRIIIELDPASGQSNLRTEGPLTIPLVIDTLLAQLNSLWAQFMKSMIRPVVGPNGEPTYKTEIPKNPEHDLIDPQRSAPPEQTPFTTDSGNPPDVDPRTPQGTPQVIDEGPYPGEPDAN
jgi:hypothetical protein